MEKSELRKIIVEIINSHKGQDGWTNLINVGSILKERGIDFKNMGYEKLILLVKENRDILNWKYIESDTNSKYLTIFVKEKNSSEKRNFAHLLKAKDFFDSGQTYHSDPKNTLTYWASLGNVKETIEHLKDLALSERWYYQNQNPRDKYPILTNYLKYTFYRLTKEKDKIIIRDGFATFNTGLVDKRYEPIHALFYETKGNAIRKWRLAGFCIAGEDKEGKDLVS